MEVADVQKEYIRDLLIHGRKTEAIEYIQVNFDLSPRDSRRLTRMIAKDISSTEYLNRQAVLSSSVWRKVALVLIMVGGCIGAYAAYLILTDYAFTQHAAQNEATVVKNSNDLILEYNVHGKIFRNEYTAAMKGVYRTGQQVPIFINPADPYHISINTFDERWKMIVIYSSVATFFLTVGLSITAIIRQY